MQFRLAAFKWSSAFSRQDWMSVDQALALLSWSLESQQCLGYWKHFLLAFYWSQSFIFIHWCQTVRSISGCILRSTHRRSPSSTFNSSLQIKEEHQTHENNYILKHNNSISQVFVIPDIPSSVLFSTTPCSPIRWFAVIAHRNSQIASMFYVWTQELPLQACPFDSAQELQRIHPRKRCFGRWMCSQRLLKLARQRQAFFAWHPSRTDRSNQSISCWSLMHISPRNPHQPMLKDSKKDRITPHTYQSPSNLLTCCVMA